jgi:predicted site-specific integrase-resolvase
MNNIGDGEKTTGGYFICEDELLRRLPICRRTLISWRKSGEIPFVRLPGARRILYHWASVEAALLRLQREV